MASLPTYSAKSPSKEENVAAKIGDDLLNTLVENELSRRVVTINGEDSQNLTAGIATPLIENQAYWRYNALHHIVGDLSELDDNSNNIDDIIDTSFLMTFHANSINKYGNSFSFILLFSVVRNVKFDASTCVIQRVFKEFDYFLVEKYKSPNCKVNLSNKPYIGRRRLNVTGSFNNLLRHQFEFINKDGGSMTFLPQLSRGPFDFNLKALNFVDPSEVMMANHLGYEVNRPSLKAQPEHDGRLRLADGTIFVAEW